MKTITIKAIVFLLWMGATFALECYHPYASFSLFLLLTVLLFICSDYIVEHVGIPLFSLLWLSSLIMPCMSFGIGLRVIHDEDSSVRLVSSYFPFGRCLAVGKKIDTLTAVPRFYKMNKNYEIVLYNEDLYIIKENDSLSILFDRHDLIFEGKNIVYFDKDFGHGPIKVFSYTTPEGQPKLVDSEGKDVNDSTYTVRIIEMPDDLGYDF